MKQENNIITLEIGKDFELMAFVAHLNKVFGVKKTGEPFNSQDIMGYMKHKGLPVYLGGNKLSRKENKEIGIIIYTIEEEKTDLFIEKSKIKENLKFL